MAVINAALAAAATTTPSSMKVEVAVNNGPDAVLEHHLRHGSDKGVNDDEETFEASDDDDDFDIDEKDPDYQYAMQLIAADPELAVDLSLPLEGSFKEKKRRVKKGISAFVRKYRETRKADKAAKAAAAGKGKAKDSSSTTAAIAPSSAVSTPAPAAVPVAATPTKTLTQTTDHILPVGSYELVDALSKLIHQDVNTSLTELSKCILAAPTSGKTSPNAYYANLALGTALGTVRLAAESRMKNGIEMKNLVQESRKTSLQRSPLDTATLAHFGTVMNVFASTLNATCSRPGTDGLQKAMDHGAIVGKALVNKLANTYMLSEHSVLNANHPVVRLGAIMTSLLSITQAQVSSQTEVNAIVQSAVRPIWANHITQESLFQVVIDNFE